MKYHYIEVRKFINKEIKEKKKTIVDIQRQH